MTLAALPGVQAAALTRVSLLSGSTSTSDVHVPDRATPLGIHMMSVSAEFFDTMQIPVRLGRAFTARDDKARAEGGDHQRGRGTRAVS